MGHLSRIVSDGGQRVLVALGGLYVAVAAAFLLTTVGGERTIGETLILPMLMCSSGLVLCYGGYRLPQTNIRPDLFGVVARWCLRAVGVMLGIVVLGALAGSVDDPVSGFVVLPALASVAGLGMGYHDARARTRALDAEERRREAEQYSRELERYQTIVETVNDGIFVADGDDRFTLVNDAYTELVGYDREELIGSHTSLVVADEEDDVSTWTEQVQRDLTVGTADAKTYEATLETASGERVEVEWTVAPLPEQDASDADRVVVVRDVTERNERERRLEEQNERLDRFAGMVAHELRNPVTIGQIYSQQLPAERDSEAVEYVTEAFDRIENIIEVMLVITRGREAVSESAPVDLADAAREAWAEVDAPDATLEVTVDQTVAADETYLRHLLRNLFENAVEHGSTSRQSPADDAVGSASDRPEADGAVGRGGDGITVTVGDLSSGFYVADDGVGLRPEDREAVFESGYTTASGHGGMGLGLTFVAEMADIYGWTCSVSESATGGAQFEFENVTRNQSPAE